MGPTKYNYVCELSYNSRSREFSNGVRGDITWRLFPIPHDLAIMAGMEYECSQRALSMGQNFRKINVECRVLLEKGKLHPKETKYFKKKRSN